MEVFKWVLSFLMPIKENRTEDNTKTRNHTNGTYKAPFSNKEVSQKQQKPSSDIEKKYWYKRYHLFSRYDDGICLDDESWYSVTPEELAEHHADRLACDVIVDGFCGAGGNSIQFAKKCNQVIAIDVDPKKIELARHNATIYGVQHKIIFIVGDFIEEAPTLRTRYKPDTVFLAPPWGGPGYNKKGEFCLETMLLPVPLQKLLEAARTVSPKVAAYLPRNSNTDDLTDVEVEWDYYAFSKPHPCAITVYWGERVGKCETKSYGSKICSEKK